MRASSGASAGCAAVWTTVSVTLSSAGADCGDRAGGAGTAAGASGPMPKPWDTTALRLGTLAAKAAGAGEGSTKTSIPS
jgi:hypothetical protein